MALTQVPPALLTATTGTGTTVVLSASPTFTGTVTTPSVTFSDASTQTAAASPYVLKNRIINGAMVIDQRNAGAAITIATGGFAVDRFRYDSSQASKFTSQQSTTAPAGFTNSLKYTTASAVSIGVSDYFLIGQGVEGFNIADFGWGAAGAKTVTLSFWVYSSLTGTFGGAVVNKVQNRSYPYSYTISSANTWTQISVTIPGDTTGSWLTNNDAGLYVYWSLGTGSSLSSTANTWAAGAYFAPTGATSVVGTNGATFYITGVQLEIGSTATPFERRLYGQEFINCQRYYQSQLIDIGNSAILSGNVTSGAEYYGSKTLQVAMRAAPTVTWGTQWGVNGFASTAPTASWLGADGFRFYKASNTTTNGGYIFQAWTASAEL